MTAEDVKAYWDERARKSGRSPTATTADVYLRELEIRTLARVLRDHVAPGAKVVDVGCGDGYSTLRVAAELDGVYFRGVDLSQEMVKLATEALEKCVELTSRVSFGTADVTSLRGGVTGEVDAVVTDRCLINLGSFDVQAAAIHQIAMVLRSGGVYVAVENFLEGHEAMNSARSTVGLPPIPVRWHNRYFSEGEFADACRPYFESITISDFASSYYFATRVIYAAACKRRDEVPDYEHDIHKFAIDLPMTGGFSPIKMVVALRR